MSGTPASIREMQVRKNHGMTAAEYDALIAAGKKPCSRCRTVLPVDSFSVDRSRRSGRNPRCKKCSAELGAEARLNDPLTFDKRYLEGRRRQLKKAGTTLEQYDELVMVQCGTCACCGNLPVGYAGRGLVPHHNHKTGKFIALICAACNLGMGKLKDDPTLLRRAADLNDFGG